MLAMFSQTDQMLDLFTRTERVVMIGEKTSSKLKVLANICVQYGL